MKRKSMNRKKNLRVKPIEPRAPELGHTGIGHDHTTEEIEGRDNERVQQGSNLNIRGPGGNHLSERNGKDDKDLEHQESVEC